VIILGIDPGTAALGYGVIERTGGRLRAIDHGCLVTSPDLPMPEGVATRIVRDADEIVRLLEPCRIVGTDLVEVAHAWDPSARTGITASWILREALLTWWGK
jgi:hypothetical protein